MEQPRRAEIEAEDEKRARRRSLGLVAVLVAVALGAIGGVLWEVVAWLRPPPVEGPPEALRSAPGLQRFIPQGPRSLLARQAPTDDAEEPPAVPREHPFAKTRITGRVYDLSTGEGIMGAKVRVRPSFGVPRLGPPSGDGGVMYTTQRDGSYALKGIPPGTFDLEVLAPGYASAKSGFKKFSAIEDDDGFDFGLARGGALEGRVRTPDGRAVVGARVTASANGALALHEASQTVVTGEDGRFLLDPVEARAVVVFATHPAFGSVAQDVAASEDPSREVELVLEPGRTLRGRVRDDDGPVAGARVLLGLQRLEERMVSVSPKLAGLDVVAGADGSFQLQVPTEGPVVLVGRATGYEEASLLVTEPAEAGREVELVLRRATEFAGVVLGADGQPAFKAEVVLAVAAPRSRRLPLHAWTGEDGRFRIEGVPTQGPYRVVVQHHLHPPLVATEASVGTNHRYQLEAGGRILGTIVDRSTGAPVKRYDLMVAGPAQRDASGVSLSGSFEVDQLPPGAYALTVGAEGFEPTTVEGLMLSPGQALENVVVRLQPSGSISGHIRGPVGHGMFVMALDAELRTAAQASVAEDGAFELADLPSGRYSVLAVGEREGGGLRGRVEGVMVESGRPTRGVEVRVEGVAGPVPEDPEP